MRKRLCVACTVLTLAAALSAGVADARKPTVVRAGNLVVSLNGGVSPTKLPKRRRGGISLHLVSSIGTTDGSQPPVAKTVTIDFDRQGTIDARGLPACREGEIEARPTAAAKAACRKAIVGAGKTTVRVQFPEQAPFTSTGPLVAFNGGVHGGKTIVFIHAYVNVPVPTALVTRVVVKRIHNGRYGTRAIARIPSIASGAGALTRFKLTLGRRFRWKGRMRSYLLSKCASGKLAARGSIAFADGTRLTGTVVRPCTPRG